LIELFVEH